MIKKTIIFQVNLDNVNIINLNSSTKLIHKKNCGINQRASQADLE
jgi:hypothetical protein